MITQNYIEVYMNFYADFLGFPLKPIQQQKQLKITNTVNWKLQRQKEKDRILLYRKVENHPDGSERLGSLLTSCPPTIPLVTLKEDTGKPCY